jgi:hypothetical protein
VGKYLHKEQIKLNQKIIWKKEIKANIDRIEKKTLYNFGFITRHSCWEKSWTRRISLIIENVFLKKQRKRNGIWSEKMSNINETVLILRSRSWSAKEINSNYVELIAFSFSVQIQLNTKRNELENELWKENLDQWGDNSKNKRRPRRKSSSSHHILQILNEWKEKQRMFEQKLG